jgi:hypothetical protein
LTSSVAANGALPAFSWLPPVPAFTGWVVRGRESSLERAPGGAPGIKLGPYQSKAHPAFELIRPGTPTGPMLQNRVRS